MMRIGEPHRTVHTCEECVHFKRYYIKLREETFMAMGIGECLYDPDSIGMNPLTRACSNFSEFDFMEHEWSKGFWLR